MPATHQDAIPTHPLVDGQLRPLSLSEVSIEGGVWRERQDLNRSLLIPHCDEWLERAGWVNNIRAALLGTLGTERVGRLFTDSEIYKIMEAMAWDSARTPSSAMQSRLVELTDLLSGAQHSDGYLGTFYGYPGGPEKYSDLAFGHELYCMGHLLQAAVAAARSGQDHAKLLAVATRAADHICREFGAEGLQEICGHPEVETALVELYRLTGTSRYLEQAKLFIDRRGHRILGDTMYGGPDYYQDRVPVREADVLVGHAVRALYLTAGVIDVAVETGDVALLRQAQLQFDATLERRTYLTGGMGSRHHGEAYGDDFELPSDRAYAETCAGVASVMVAWRLLLATGESRYADAIERTLYNVVATSPSQDGHGFFYVNTLHRRELGIPPEPGIPSLRRTDGMRAEWFTTSCCPTNVARLLASLGGYIATTDDTGVQVHQYVTGTVTAGFAGERAAQLRIETDYPTDGRVTIRVDATDETPWTLSLRVPAWATTATLDDGDGARHVEPGIVKVERRWSAGDIIRLDFNIEARVTDADPRIDATRGCVAVEWGPIVYCLESVDNPGVDLSTVLFDKAGSLVANDTSTVAGRLPLLMGEGVSQAPPSLSWPYGDPSLELPIATERMPLTFSPYQEWANRGPSAMRVWIPVDRGRSAPSPAVKEMPTAESAP